MSPEIIHSILLIATIAFSFILMKTPLAEYDLQIGAVFFIILFVSRNIFGRWFRRFEKLFESLVFTCIILLIINSTGGIASPLFFLTYFLLFSLSLLLEPIIPITTTLTLIVFFLLSLPENQTIKSLLPIFSLAFLTPFAMFLGQEYVKNEKLKVKSEELEKTITSNQEQTFLFLSLMLKNHMKSIRHAVDNFMGDHELSKIKHHAKEMERLIEKYEKNT